MTQEVEKKNYSKSTVIGIAVTLLLVFIAYYSQSLINKQSDRPKQNQHYLQEQAINMVKNYPQPGENSIDHLLQAITLATSFVDGTEAVGWRTNKDKSDNKGYRVFYVFKAGNGRIGLRQWEVDLKTGTREAKDERAQQILDMVNEIKRQKEF